jgi:hypothetical protein
MKDEAAKQSARLRTLAEQVAEPAVAGRDGGKALKAKHRNDWRRITDVVCAFPCTTEACYETAKVTKQTDEHASKHLAGVWKSLISQNGNGIGYKRVPIVGLLFPMPGFWSIFLPLLIELAKRWIESQRNADTQQGLDGER